MTVLLSATGLALPGRLEPTGLEIAGGELVCLIGPNGSGKTSLLHALAGIGQPHGDVRIGGMNPADAGKEQRLRLFSYLPASRDIRWPLSARDVIRLGLPAGDGDVAAPADRLELESLLDRRIDRLSTGERSRVLIGRALAAQPRLLLLDEPVANLDPLWQLRLLDQLAAIAAGGERSILLAIHDLDLARRYAGRIIMMDHGRIAACGAPQAIVEGPEIRAIFGIERRNGAWVPA